MSARRKPPRLFLRPSRGSHPARWVILDAGHEEGTGCGEFDTQGASEALRSYLGRKHLTKTLLDQREPENIPLADVIALYARDVVPSHSRPEETAKRLSDLLCGFPGKVLAQINAEECREYAKTCSTDSAARRRLEELRAAINYHRAEGHCSKIIAVWLPPKRASRERWLQRDEAASIIRASWRYREKQKGVETERRSRRHVAKFTLVALYTGTRAGPVCAASFYPMPDRAYVDVDRGVFYRRAPGVRQTKKRQPPVPLPPRLLAHLRRWKAMGQKYVVEWERRPVRRVSKAFRNVVRDLGFNDVMPHTLRHTAATWMMQAGTEPWVAAGFLGMTLETLLENYGHHHPDFLAGARDAFARMKR